MGTWTRRTFKTEKQRNTAFLTLRRELGARVAKRGKKSVLVKS